MFLNEISLAPVATESGEIRHYIGVLRDISEQIAFETRLRELASTDPLTGLHNRRRFESLVAREMRRAHREEGRGYGDLPGLLVQDLLQGTGHSRVTARMATIGLTALLDGLWLEWCLDRRGFRPAEAIALCEDWVDRIVPATAAGAP